MKIKLPQKKAQQQSRSKDQRNARTEQAAPESSRHERRVPQRKKLTLDSKSKQRRQEKAQTKEFKNQQLQASEQILQQQQLEVIYARLSHLENKFFIHLKYLKGFKTFIVISFLLDLWLIFPDQFLIDTIAQNTSVELLAYFAAKAQVSSLLLFVPILYWQQNPERVALKFFKLRYMLAFFSVTFVVIALLQVLTMPQRSLLYLGFKIAVILLAIWPVLKFVLRFRQLDLIEKPFLIQTVLTVGGLLVIRLLSFLSSSSVVVFGTSGRPESLSGLLTADHQTAFLLLMLALNVLLAALLPLPKIVKRAGQLLKSF